MPGNRVLLIDDDALIRRQVHDALTEAAPELELSEAPDGEAGIARIGSFAPDLVLLDLFMPNLSGVETLSLIRAQRSDLKVVILSSLDSDTMKAELLSAGADGFIGKPFHAVELAQEVRRHLR
jgi:two-component system, chemotaxis family, chemotaxis protein CheY